MAKEEKATKEFTILGVKEKKTKEKKNDIWVIFMDNKFKVDHFNDSFRNGCGGPVRQYVAYQKKTKTPCTFYVSDTRYNHNPDGLYISDVIRFMKVSYGQQALERLLFKILNTIADNQSLHIGNVVDFQFTTEDLFKVSINGKVISSIKINPKYNPPVCSEKDTKKSKKEKKAKISPEEKMLSQFYNGVTPIEGGTTDEAAMEDGYKATI